MPLYQVNAGDRILAADTNQYFQILKGVAASGETITLIYNAAASIIIQPSSDPTAGTEAIQLKNNAGTVQSALSFDGRLYPADGLVGTPGVAYEQDKDTGLWRVAANAMALVAGGTERVRVDGTGTSLDAGTTYLRTVSGEQLTYDRWPWYWAPPTALESTLTGTATFTNPTATRLTQAQLATGATSASTGGLRLSLDVDNSVTGATAGANKIRLWAFNADFVQIDANTAYQIFITDENVTTVPSNTAKHLGIRVAGAVVNFSTADGATEQTTAITAFVAQATTYRFAITFDGTTARFYVNGVLRATHATNVPTATANTGPVLRVWNTNSAAASKILALGSMFAVLDVAAS